MAILIERKIARHISQITDKVIHKIKKTCVKILKQLFALGSVIFGEYSPRHSPIISSPSANNCLLKLGFVCFCILKRIFLSEKIFNSRAVRRGIRMTEKFLNDQEDINNLNITDKDINERNIFHLSVQREELLEFVLDKFKKV